MLILIPIFPKIFSYEILDEILEKKLKVEKSGGKIEKIENLKNRSNRRFQF